MKRIVLPAPANMSREERAAWSIWPDHKVGAMRYSQAHHRERLLRLARGEQFADGDMSLASRRQKNEIAAYQKALAAIK